MTPVYYPLGRTVSFIRLQQFRSMSPGSPVEAIGHAYLISGRFNRPPLMKLAGDEHEETRASLRSLIAPASSRFIAGAIKL